MKEIGNYAGYYREALRYLGCEDQTKLSQSEKQLQAVLLGFAALLGDDVYNFGELVRFFLDEFSVFPFHLRLHVTSVPS